MPSSPSCNWATASSWASSRAEIAVATSSCSRSILARISSQSGCASSFCLASPAASLTASRQRRSSVKSKNGSRRFSGDPFQFAGMQRDQRIDFGLLPPHPFAPPIGTALTRFQRRRRQVQPYDLFKCQGCWNNAVLQVREFFCTERMQFPFELKSASDARKDQNR